MMLFCATEPNLDERDAGQQKRVFSIALEHPEPGP